MTAPVSFVPETAHGDHLLLPDRKAILVRLAIAWLRTECAEDEGAVADLDVLQLAVESWLTQSTLEQGEELGQFLANIAAAFRADKRPQVARQAERFCALAQIDCPSCAGRNKPCQLTRFNAENMGQRAACWRFFNQLCAELTSIAEQEYAPFLRHHPARTLRIRFETQRSGAAELGAETRFPKASALCREARIALQLPVDAFNEAHLTRLPYVLFHEICVHAPECWLDDERHRGGPLRTTELCALREGFVDAAAAWLLVHHISRDPRRFGALARHYVTATRHAHSERASTGGKGLSRTGEDRALRPIKKKREQGQSLFRDFLDATAADGGPFIRAEALSRLALALNLLPIPELQRWRLLQFLRAALPPNALKARLDWFSRLTTAAEAGDLATVEAEISGLLAVDDYGG